MVYFIAFTEGGKFVRIKRRSLRPKIVIKRILSKSSCVAIFKNGMIYDGFLKNRRTKLRHIYLGGRKSGCEYYKYLMKQQMPEEEII